MADQDWASYVKTAEESGFGEPAPLGTYTVQILSAEAGESSNKKTPQIQIKMKITEGPHAGKRPTHFAPCIYKSEGSAGMFIGSLAAVGITGEVLVKHNPTLDQIARSMNGKTVQVTTRHATGKYEMMNDGVTKKIEMAGLLKPPASGAVEVTSFPPVTANTVVNAGSSAPAGGFTTDPGF
jgi:hypothetical protein